MRSECSRSSSRTDVRVAMGAERPLVRELHVAAHVHGESGLDGPELPARASEPVAQAPSTSSSNT